MLVRQGIEMNEGGLNDLYTFDTATSSWTGPIETKGEAPAARSFHKVLE